jgi:hypothetical protein
VRRKAVAALLKEQLAIRIADGGVNTASVTCDTSEIGKLVKLIGGEDR